MSENEEQLLDAEGLKRTLQRMAFQIVEGRSRTAPLQFVGIRSRGYPIALRLAETVKAEFGLDIPVGAVDITLYRDDLHKTNRWPVLLGTQIPFELDGADVVLVDDVLFTGRTVRAALNTICDLGRPSRVRLAVLVDRGHREIPIQPDIVGLSVKTRWEQRVKARVKPIDGSDEVVQVV